MVFSSQTTLYLQTLNSPYTVANYGRALEHFRVWYLNNYATEPDATLLTDKDALGWCNYLSSERRLRASTVNHHLSVIRGLAHHYGCSLSTKGLKKAQPPAAPLTAEELECLLAAAAGDDWLDKRDQALLEMIVGAGLQARDIITLKRADITVDRKGQKVVIRPDQGGKEQRWVLEYERCQGLRAYLDAPVLASAKGEWLFVSFTGRRLSARDVQRTVKKIASRAGIVQPVTPQILRKTFAVHALRGGVDPTQLARRLGHRTPTTIARYMCTRST